ncbi:MAG TPA: hypothetical protein VJ969_04185, partial [Desulfopila sp.]|nr:hypothetical protein [Desulfopila sp.]
IYTTHEKGEEDTDQVYSVETLSQKISENLSTQKEIKWYSVLVENLSEGYSTFALLESGTSQVGISSSGK